MSFLLVREANAPLLINSAVWICLSLFGTLRSPPRWVFFAWEAFWGKYQLKRRGRALANNRCFLCGEGEDTVDHLLVHCSKAGVLRDLVLAIFGVSWVFLLSTRETLLSWHGSFVGKRRKKAWMSAPLCTFWTIWCERNNFF